MKILHLSTTDIIGGAAKAAYRIHKGLLDQGVSSKMLVRVKDTDDYTVKRLDNNLDKLQYKINHIAENLAIKPYLGKEKDFFSPGLFGDRSFLKYIKSYNPDVVHLHITNAGFLSIDGIKEINKPIVWTLHTKWAFTGGCHFDNCNLHQNQCQKCPCIGSKNSYDLSSFVHNKKKKAWKNMDFTIVSPSEWLAECAKSSFLMKDQRVETIPNGLDLNLYKPLDKGFVRDALALPQDKKLILFGASNSLEDERKGYKYLIEAIKKLSDGGKLQNTEIVIFGSEEPEKHPDLNFKIHYLGSLRDNISMPLVYSAADVMIVPSLQEAFGQTASESLACGTPVVAFKTTGLLEIVDHKSNGYLLICVILMI